MRASDNRSRLPAVRGWLRAALRAPVRLYQAHLGWLLGNRFLLLEHTGRRSGLPRRTVLEVVDHDRSTDGYTVASGWGPSSDWFRNIQHTPPVHVSSGRRSYAATARVLTPAEARQVLERYAGHHPFAFRILARAMGGRSMTGTAADADRLSETIPLVALVRRTGPES